MPSPDHKSPHPHHRHWVTQILHLALWLTPASLLTAAVLLSQHTTLPTLSLWISIPLLLIITLAFGSFDSLLSPDLPTKEGTPDTSSLIAHTLEFCMVQLAFAPVASIALWLLFTFTPFFA